MAALFARGSGEDGLNFIEFQRWFVNGDRQLLVHFGWAVQAMLARADSKTLPSS